MLKDAFDRVLDALIRKDDKGPRIPYPRPFLQPIAQKRRHVPHDFTGRKPLPKQGHANRLKEVGLAVPVLGVQNGHASIHLLEIVVIVRSKVKEPGPLHVPQRHGRRLPRLLLERIQFSLKDLDRLEGLFIHGGDGSCQFRRNPYRRNENEVGRLEPVPPEPLVLSDHLVLTLLQNVLCPHVGRIEGRDISVTLPFSILLPFPSLTSLARPSHTLYVTRRRRIRRVNGDYLSPMRLEYALDALQCRIGTAHANPRHTHPHLARKPRFLHHLFPHPRREQVLCDNPTLFAHLNANRSLRIHRQRHKPIVVVNVVLGHGPICQVPVKKPVAQHPLSVILLNQRTGIAPRALTRLVDGKGGRLGVLARLPHVCDRVRDLDLLLMNVAEEHEVVPLELFQGIRVFGLTHVTRLEARLGDFAMKQRHPVRHVLGKARRVRERRWIRDRARRRAPEKRVLNRNEAKAHIIDF